jgi:hypothetical protein
LINKYNFQIIENNIVVSEPTIFCISSNVNKNKVYVIQSDNLYNPCDFVEDLFKSLMEIELELSSFFVDLRKYYGKYTDSWLWKCTFIKDDNCEFEDLITEDVSSVQLSNNEDAALKEYLYKNLPYDEVLACV